MVFELQHMGASLGAAGIEVGVALASGAATGPSAMSLWVIAISDHFPQDCSRRPKTHKKKGSDYTSKRRSSTSVTKFSLELAFPGAGSGHGWSDVTSPRRHACWTGRPGKNNSPGHRPKRLKIFRVRGLDGSWYWSWLGKQSTKRMQNVSKCSISMLGEVRLLFLWALLRLSTSPHFHHHGTEEDGDSKNYPSPRKNQRIPHDLCIRITLGQCLEKFWNCLDRLLAVTFAT